MTKTEIAEIYNKNIMRLRSEIDAYTNDDAMWTVSGKVSNPGGNLALHLMGNLSHFIGATLGKTAYVRERDAEFATKGLSKEALLALLDETEMQVVTTFNALPDNVLQQDYPFDFAGKRSTEFYLVFFIAHFEYHLGQINYHRRIGVRGI